ncbi:MAG: hypothetical protein IJO32_07980 [Bacilli bacterium]|nr:hypothetical protein [Bacilli bacterium]
MVKIKLPENFDEKYATEIRLQKIANELKEKKVDNNKGFLYHNGLYIPYEYKIETNNDVYFVNMSLANGTHRGTLMAYMRGYTMGKYSDYNDLFEFITIWCKLSYKVIELDNIKFLYIFNNKYKHMFNDDNNLE